MIFFLYPYIFHSLEGKKCNNQKRKWLSKKVCRKSSRCPFIWTFYPPWNFLLAYSGQCFPSTNQLQSCKGSTSCCFSFRSKWRGTKVGSRCSTAIEWSSCQERICRLIICFFGRICLQRERQHFCAFLQGEKGKLLHLWPIKMILACLCRHIEKTSWLQEMWSQLTETSFELSDGYSEALVKLHWLKNINSWIVVIDSPNSSLRNNSGWTKRYVLFFFFNSAINRKSPLENSIVSPPEPKKDPLLDLHREFYTHIRLTLRMYRKNWRLLVYYCCPTYCQPCETPQEQRTMRRDATLA